MPSELIRRHRTTISLCHKRLQNSVIGTAYACLAISNEIRDSGMEYTYLHSSFRLLESEFCAMYNVLKDVPFILDTMVWDHNASTTVRRVQEVCQQVAWQVRDVMRRSQVWVVVAPDHVGDRLNALAVLLQEQQMTLELLTVVMAFVDPKISGPAVLQHYRHIGLYVKRYSDTD